MMNCRRMSRRISESLDRPLSIIQWLSMRLHLLLCPSCARFWRAIHWLHRSFPTAPVKARLSEDARGRIRQALEEAAGEI
jgi:hypothetical protein